jgi:hypothetical protein
MPAAALDQANGFQTAMAVDGGCSRRTCCRRSRSGKQNGVLPINGRMRTGSIFTPESTTGESFRATPAALRRAGHGPQACPFTTDTGLALRVSEHARPDVRMGDAHLGPCRLTRASRVYLYYLSHVPPLPNAAWLGAQRAEIPYTAWPNGKYAPRCRGPGRQSSPSGVVIWVNFATTGDEWERPAEVDAVSNQDHQAMGIAGGLGMIPLPNGPALDLSTGPCREPFDQNSSKELPTVTTAATRMRHDLRHITL